MAPSLFGALGEPLVAGRNVEHHPFHFGLGHAFCDRARAFGAIEPVPRVITDVKINHRFQSWVASLNTAALSGFMIQPHYQGSCS